MTDNSTTEECKIEIKLKELAELYLIVKETILYFEEVNPDQKNGYPTHQRTAQCIRSPDEGYSSPHRAEGRV